MGRACRAAGISRSAAYKRRETHLMFATGWDEIMAESCDDLEASVWKRAQASDTLAIFLLKAHRPERYGRVGDATVINNTYSGEQSLAERGK